MDEKNNNEKKRMNTMTEVTQKTVVAQRIGIAIAVLGFIGGAIGASLALAPTTGGTKPGSFILVSPENIQAKVGTSGSLGINVTLSWSASSGATSYDVYVGPPLKLVKIATVYPDAGVTTPSTSLPLTLSTFGVRPALAAVSYSYIAKLNPQTVYNWKIVAKNSAGSTSSSVFSFTTIADFPWLQTDAGQYVQACKIKDPACKTDPGVTSACGGQRVCDAQDPSNVLDCAEFQRIWSTCNSYTNKCPESLADDCMEQTTCQCNGKAPGGPDCTTYISTLTNPC